MCIKILVERNLPNARFCGSFSKVKRQQSTRIYLADITLYEFKMVTPLTISTKVENILNAKALNQYHNSPNSIVKHNCNFNSHSGKNSITIKDLIANIEALIHDYLLLVNTTVKDNEQYNTPVLLEDDLEFL